MKLFKKLRREIATGLSKLGLHQLTVDYMGMRLVVPLLAGIGRGYLIAADFWMSRSLQAFTQLKSGAIIDVCANVGVFLVKLRVVDRERPYYGFEPHPVCNFYAQELIRLNRFPNTHYYPYALSNEQEIRTLYASKLGDKMASMHAFARDNAAQLGFSFEMVTQHGDSFISALGIEQVAAIKIDVEGAEWEVLQGLEQTIKQHRPFLFCEIWPLPESADPNYAVKLERRQCIFDFLQQMDYQILGVQSDATLGWITSCDEMASPYHPEYLFCPTEQQSQLYDTLRGVLDRDGL